MDIFGELNQYVDFSQLFTVTILSYAVIKFFLPNTLSARNKRLVVFVTGLLTGAGIFLYDKTGHTPFALTNAIIVSILGYDFFIKILLDKLGLHYQDTDPEIMKGNFSGGKKGEEEKQEVQKIEDTKNK